jgi:NTE family protein
MSLPEPITHPFECVALLLQGGGALGAYQAGVYEALSEAGIKPDWVAGISIGAINAAIIAGNPPETRIRQLRAFWEQITDATLGSVASYFLGDRQIDDTAHGVLNRFGAMEALFGGAPGFFKPRLSIWGFPPGALSYYDTLPLRATLEKFVDFDRINAKQMRFSVGAVDVRSGNFTYFDTETYGPKIRPEHIMASGALPPGFPPIEIDGEYFWDGGLVSNTPLQWVFDNATCRDTLAFQVDLWNSRGELPADLNGVAVRQKEIQYSSRTRAITDQLQQLQKVRSAIATLMKDASESTRAREEAKLLAEFADPKNYNVVHLIYRNAPYELDSKDYNFSRRSMLEHWRAGRADAHRALRHKEIFERPTTPEDSFRTFDFKSPDDHFPEKDEPAP